MAPALHRVRRLRWQARSTSAAEAFALRQALHERGDAIEAALGRAFDRVAPPGTVWRVPRLELRLRVPELGQLEAGLEAALQASLEQALADAALDATRDIWSDLPSDAAGAGIADPEGSGRAVAGPALQAEPLAARAALRHYLAHGLLPWAWNLPEPEPVLRQAAEQACQDVLDGRLVVDALLPADGLLARVGALARWLALLPATLRRHWVAAHRPAEPLAALGPAWPAPPVDDSATTDRQALWLAWPAEHEAAPRTDEWRALRHWLGLQAAGSTVGSALAIELARRLDGPVPAGLAITAADAPEAPPANPAADRAEAAPRPPAAAALPTDDAAPALLVPLAGLVLLHPYLPRLLAGCSVLAERERQITEARLPRACALLHALACGPREPAEHQLPLVKLLLGHAPDAPLAAALPALSAADHAEVEAVLAACRGHWRALRGTGSEALRVAFLQRRGLLARADRAWSLRLQGEAHDVLVGLLPWAIGIVRLPWMAEPLVVDWPGA